MVEFLAEPHSTDPEETSELEYVKFMILDIIIKCIKEHGYRMRMYAMNRNLIDRIVNLKSLNSKLINIYILKVIRAFIGNKDDLMLKHMMSQKHFESIFTMFEENQYKENLFHS